MNGAMFQMIAHGITSAGMFFLVGVIYDRAHHRNLDNFRGLYEPMPLYGGISAVIFFAAMGLPGMCGFVGEFMVVLATWNLQPRSSPILAALTVVLTAAYILWTIQRVFLGAEPGLQGLPGHQPARAGLHRAAGGPGGAARRLRRSLLLNWMEPSVTGLVDTPGAAVELADGEQAEPPRAVASAGEPRSERDPLAMLRTTHVMLHDWIDTLQASLGRDLLAFLPELILCGAIVLLLLLRLFSASNRLHLGSVALVLTLVALASAGASGADCSACNAGQDSRRTAATVHRPARLRQLHASSCACSCSASRPWSSG